MANKTVSQLIESEGPSYDDIIEISQVSRAVTISATTISALASDNSFNDSGNGFVAAGFSAGDHVKVVGFTGNVVNNINSGVITDLTAGKMTIGGGDGDVIVDDAAGEAVTISKWITRRAPRFGKVLLQEITLSSAGEFDFDNIPQGFNRLIIEGAIRSNVSSIAESIYMLYNGDTAATNYHSQTGVSFNAAGIAPSEAAEPIVGTVPGATAVSGAMLPFRVQIEGYAGSNLKTVVNPLAVYRSADNIASGIYGHHWDSPSAITRVQIRSSTSPTNAIFGTVRLYGEN